MTAAEKRANSPENNSTPAKRVRTETADNALASVSAPREELVSSSPAPGRDGNSPSVSRGGRGGRGGGRGGGDKSRGGSGSRGGYDRRGTVGRGRGGREVKMRTWGPKEPEAEGEMKGEDEEKKERFPKKKVAVLFGYNGIGYFGSQINPVMATVEGEVFQALVKAGTVSEDNASNHQKVGLSRAARTDSGVHAAVNVIALKLILAPPSLPDNTTIEAYINSFLPQAIRIWSLLRVQGSFNPRSLCDQRHYEYTVPTHVFLGPKPGTALAKWLLKSRASAKAAALPATTAPVEESSAPLEVDTASILPSTETETESEAAIAESDKFWASQPNESSFSKDLAAKRAWRMSPGLLKSAREFVSAFDGSHNFHNYTVGKEFRDRSCQRVMRKLEISDPFIVNDVEYVAVSFLGQSFMLHQIRKMIGLAILAIRTSTPPSLVPETFGPSRIHVPKAPGLGLCLLEPQYLEYNKKVAESNEKFINLNSAGKMDDTDLVNSTRDPVEIGNLKAEVDKFKQEQIYTKMWELEEKDAVFSKWLNYLDVYSGPDFEYLNSKGVIPQSAMFKKGENPEKVRGAPASTEDLEEVAPPSDDEVVAGEEEG